MARLKPVPVGGPKNLRAARDEALWADADGHPVAQGDPNARFAEIVIYDADGNEIQRTYGTVNNE